jgi:hypothetical protein
MIISKFDVAEIFNHVSLVEIHSVIVHMMVAFDNSRLNKNSFINKRKTE